MARRPSVPAGAGAGGTAAAVAATGAAVEAATGAAVEAATGAAAKVTAAAVCCGSVRGATEVAVVNGAKASVPAGAVQGARRRRLRAQGGSEGNRGSGVRRHRMGWRRACSVPQ